MFAGRHVKTGAAMGMCSCSEGHMLALQVDSWSDVLDSLLAGLLQAELPTREGSYLFRLGGRGLGEVVIQESLALYRLQRPGRPGYHWRLCQLWNSQLLL